MSEKYENALVLLERMETLLREYEQKGDKVYADSLNEGAAGYISRIVSGHNPFSSSVIHAEYFEEMGRASRLLAEGLDSLSEEDREAAGELAFRAVELLLTPAAEERKYLELSYMADDQHADGLIRFLSDDKLQYVYEWMMGDRKRMLFVPSQEKTATLIKDEMKARGIPLPASGFMQKLRDAFKK